MSARHAHRDDFARLADEFPRRLLLEILGVDRATLRRWRTGRARVPWAAFQLLYERSRYGLAERDAAEHFNRTMLEQLNEALRERVAWLEAELRSQAALIFGSANDPYIRPADPRARQLKSP